MLTLGWATLCAWVELVPTTASTTTLSRRGEVGHLFDMYLRGEDTLPALHLGSRWWRGEGCVCKPYEKSKNATGRQRARNIAKASPENQACMGAQSRGGRAMTAEFWVGMCLSKQPLLF